jgi:hypothetical protein
VSPDGEPETKVCVELVRGRSAVHRNWHLSWLGAVRADGLPNGWPIPSLTYTELSCHLA